MIGSSVSVVLLFLTISLACVLASDDEYPSIVSSMLSEDGGDFDKRARYTSPFVRFGKRDGMARNIRNVRHLDFLDHFLVLEPSY
jgi:hypothetical protein